MENIGTWHEKAHVATEGIRFQCQRCSKCCKLAVILSYRDVEEIRKLDKNSESPIIKTYNPKYNKHGEVFSLLHMGSGEELGTIGYCAYLKRKECRAYAGRPITCKTYPFSVILKKKMKDKHKLPRHAPTFIDTYTSRSFVVVFDPDCPGIGKGEEVNLEAIASLEFTGISNFVETYSKGLKDKIPELLCSKEDCEAMAKYEEGLEVISYSFTFKPILSENTEFTLYTHFGFNPDDIKEAEAKELVDWTVTVWQQNYTKAQGVFVNYIFSKAGEMPQKVLPVYVGLQPIKPDIKGIELMNVFRLMYNLDEVRTKSKTSAVAIRVRLDNGKWSTVVSDSS